jgi:ABC-type thiamine transport system substrate-binding protein
VTESHPIQKEIPMKQLIYLIGLLSLLLSACAPQGPQTLTVLTHDSFSVSEDLIRQFERE